MTSQPIAVPDAQLPDGLLDFTPVPRRYRHDGWTPERQRVFIGWLAVTGCVERAARMVNIAQTNPQVTFVRADLFQGIAIGALEPAAPLEELVPFAPGEAPWELAGVEKPAALVAIEAKGGPAGPAGADRGALRRRGSAGPKPK